MSKTSDIPSDRANVRGARVEDEAPVRALTMESLVSVEEQWIRSWCAGGEGLGKAEGGERGMARGVSRESTEPVRPREDWECGLRARSMATGSSNMTGRGEVGSCLSGRGACTDTSASSP